MADMTKRQRLAEANRVLEAIARHGRRFFHNAEHDRVARFEIDIAGRLWFRDDYTWRRIFTAWRGNWRQFSHGGTMRRLVDDLAAYIRTGPPIAGGHFGPWPQWYCDGDLWGYGADAMAALRDELAGSDAIRFPTLALQEPTLCPA